MVAPSRVAFVLVVLFVLPLAASDLSIEPLGPVAGQPVTLRAGTNCFFTGQTVTRDGFAIHVVVQRFHGPCGDPPIVRPYPIRLGTFTVGEYHVDLKDDAGTTLGTMSFIVRAAEPHELITVHPWAITTEPAGLKLKFDVDLSNENHQHPCGADCATTFIRIGDTSIPWTQLDADGRVDAPPHAQGLVDVRIVNPQGTIVLPGALYYYDGEKLDPSAFERILFPVLFQTAGAGGSQWRSEAVVSNPTPWNIQTWNTVLPFVCLNFPCGQRLEPREQQKFDGVGYPHGHALLVGRDDAPDLSFHLRVRDTSRQAQSFGTEIPVVREADMVRNHWISLLDIPSDSRFRVKVRIYAFPDSLYDGLRNSTEASVVSMKPSATTSSALTRVTLDAPCVISTCTDTPLYGEVDLAPQAGTDRVDVYVRLPEGAMGWAFASITNNETQEVTITTPDGRGGAPCDHCF